MVSPVSDNFTAPSGTTVLAGGRDLGITLDNSYERASLDIASSSVTGIGDATLVTAAPLRSEAESGGAGYVWREIGFAMDNVGKAMPQIHVPLAGNDGNQWINGSPNRHMMWSSDLERFHYMTTTTVNSGAGRIECSHNKRFPTDRIYITRSRQMPVHMVGKRLARYRQKYPTMVAPAPSALAFTPTGLVSASFQAQEFIAAEYDSQNDDLGVAEPPTPFYAAKISDSSLTPPSGSKAVFWICGGVHAAEDYGDHLMMMFIDHWLSDAEDAQYLRRYLDVIWYPCMNSIGRAMGFVRGAAQDQPGGGDDLNRHYHETLPTGLQIVDKPRQAMILDIGNGVAPLLHFAFHAPFAGSWGLAVDGVANTGVLRTRTQLYFGQTVSDNDDTPAGSTVAYCNSLGCKLAIHIESGDPTNVTDADMRRFTYALLRAVKWMHANDYFL